MMKVLLKTFLIFAVFISVIVGLAYYGFTQVDFIGHKDPKSIEENVRRFNNIIFSAAYRNGTEYYEVELLDSVNVEINVGDKYGSTILNKEYKLVKDTIIVIGGSEHAKKYLNSNKFFIKNDQLLFKINNNGSFDTLITMKVKFNKINSSWYQGF